jgi:hypothetical protein
VIVSLTQDSIRRAAKTAAREQAWKDRHGVLGVPVRRDGHDYPLGRNSDLTVVDDLIDSADALVWRGEELTVRHRHDVDQYIGIVRPGFDREGGDRIEIMGSPDLDWMLQLAEAETSGSGTGDDGGAQPVVSVLTCLNSECGLIGHPYPGRAEAQALSGIHNNVHHGGGDAAQAGTVTQMCWEIDGPDGTPLFRVADQDIDLADDLYRASPPGSHLVPVMALAGGR